jgi:hypothetical protein
MAGGLTTLAEDESIHDFDFKLICEYFSGMERQGPGSPEVTIKALSFKRILRMCFLYREKDLKQIKNQYGGRSTGSPVCRVA